MTMPKKKPKPKPTARERLIQHYKKLKPPKHVQDLSHRDLSPKEKAIALEENRQGKIAFFKRRKLAMAVLQCKLNPKFALAEVPLIFQINIVNLSTGEILKSSDSPWVLLQYLGRNPEMISKTYANDLIKMIWPSNSSSVIKEALDISVVILE